MAGAQDPPRIVVYGVGQYGGYIVRLAVAKGWPIVAAYNRAGPKVGQDVGRLAGLDRDRDLGVIVEDCDTGDLGELAADIGVVAMTDRIATNLPAYRRLMNAGLNVICHGGEAINPHAANAAVAAEIEACATVNGVSFTGSGVWDISRIWLGLLASGNCTTIRSMFHRSVTDSENFDHTILLGTGTGMTIAEFEDKISSRAGQYGDLYVLAPQLVLTTMGYTVTSATERRELVLYDEPYYCKALDRTPQPGECIGSRTVVETLTVEGVTSVAHMEVRPLRPGDDREHMMWSIDGEPSSTITIERHDAPLSTIASVFNRIPDVIAAPPGIRPITELGPMRHSSLLHI